ncbi:MAG TPA: YafY family protein [Candidatus Dormibacteraeota bacterium]|jgi:predicted DNA-binding transcriptional regulator YafY|nr:YafY family protein [Candidatus Dormibacteraeota bacterium]
MLETSGRLLRLLSLLQNPRDWTGGELADRLGVTTRTIRNDVERLRGLGYPVHGTRGSVGGYRLGAGADLPPLLLEDEEAVAVTVGLRSAATGAIAGIEETSLRALVKLERVLPTRLRRRVNALQAAMVAIPPDQPPPTVDAMALTTMASACRDRDRLRFRYRDHSGNASLRTVEPYRLVNWGQRWYLVAWDAGREDWRTFRIDRVGSLQPIGPRFLPRAFPEEDIAAYVARRVSATAWRFQARITVQAPAEVVAQRLPAAVGTVEAVDDRTCILHTGADSVDTVAVYAGLLGVDFTVDQPELAAKLREMAGRYVRATG